MCVNPLPLAPLDLTGRFIAPPKYTLSLAPTPPCPVRKSEQTHTSKFCLFHSSSERSYSMFLCAFTITTDITVLYNLGHQIVELCLYELLVAFGSLHFLFRHGCRGMDSEIRPCSAPRFGSYSHYYFFTNSSFVNIWVQLYAIKNVIFLLLFNHPNGFVQVEGSVTPQRGRSDPSSFRMPVMEDNV